MMSSAKHLFSCLLYFIIICSSAFSQPKTEPKKLTPEQIERLKERDSLLRSATEAENKGKHGDSLLLLEKAFRIAEEVYGINHPEMAKLMSRIAEQHFHLRNWGEAHSMRQLAYEILVIHYGEQDWRSVDAKLDLADVSVLRKMSEAKIGDLFRAQQLTNEGTRLQAEHKYTDAAKRFTQSLEINQKLFGELNRKVALDLNRLAGAYLDAGMLAKAEPLVVKAVTNTREIVGDQHPTYAVQLNNLGMMYLNSGHYAKAEQPLREALKIRREVLGESDPLYARSLNNLATLASKTGDLATAASLYTRALEINRKAFGDQDPNYFFILGNLAECYVQIDPAKAEPLLRQVVDYQRKTLGENNPTYAISLNNLAAFYGKSGDFARSIPLLEKAVEIIRATRGEWHPEYALMLSNLATQQRRAGETKKAETALRKVLEIQTKSLGELHPDYAQTLVNLSFLHLDVHEPAKAEPLLKQAIEIHLKLLESTSDVQTEEVQIAFAQSTAGILFVYETAALESGLHPASEAYALSLQWKGQVFVRQRRQRELTNASRDPKTAKLTADLLEITRQLAAVSGQHPSAEKVNAWRTQVAALMDQRQEYERELTRISARFSQQKERETMTPDRLKKLLPANTALVDLLVYRHFTTASKGNNGKWEDRLLAFVVLPERDVVRLELGPFEPIRDAIDNWRKDTNRKRPVRDDDDPAAVLRDKLWLPIAKHLDGVSVVLISPDRDLAKLPFAALPGLQDGKYLIEEMAVAVLPVPQFLPDLLRPQPPANPSLLLVGDVDYGADPGKPKASGTSDVAVRGNRGGGDWKALPATREEVAAINKSFVAAFPDRTARTMRAADPTEEAVRNVIGQYRFIHLATHGFFSPPEVRAMAGRPSGDASIRGVAGFLPGLLSGIVLAGANRPYDPTNGSDDGILTAAEVGTLDLRGVEMVVLSACETGLGQTAGGEGVLGLQRAFQVAGARTVVASLWEVPDEATRTLMTWAYENWWNGKKTKLEGLIEAQRRMLKEGVPSPDGKLVKGRTPPYYWAAFVLSGDWR